MLPKINCLKADKDFKKVFNDGKTSESNLIKIRFLKNFKKHSRFGFVVSNAFAPKAVSRNLIKRRLRAVAHFLLKNIKPGFDIIVWPKPALKKSAYQAILNNFKNILINNALLFI
ncbi:MAG: ribonuclease P protein component [Candidatus Azambacteria bacterium]|nr:ribonuclease P protein component [Candidatus Azambacteria bacterium]